jgi:histidine triad (HIT) family protein
MTDCLICRKHVEPSRYTGPAILEEGGLRLSHFPVLDGAPATRGHLLIEPTRHVCDLSEMSEAEARALGVLVARGCALLKERLGAEHVYLFRINDQVAHLHFHLVPRYPGTPRENWGLKLFDWAGAPKIDLDQVKAVCAQLQTAPLT